LTPNAQDQEFSFDLGIESIFLQIYEITAPPASLRSEVPNRLTLRGMRGHALGF
jgi:hypothetical protein